ncbi:J domain-containing protein [Arthrobacter sp. NPDC056886]|uniref:J domain-containing protein n=1 Tax=Arthrobacter sp. NPDC056886 TaxID=3345960 RepID=UPI00366CE5F4
MPGRNPDPRGYYALLHVSPEASRQEIGRAFRALMRRHHPDRHHADMRQLETALPDGGDASAILRAFAVLRDARTRAEYDAGSWRADVQSGQNLQDGVNGSGGRDIPVCIIRRRDPLVRVLPVRWESGP